MMRLKNFLSIKRFKNIEYIDVCEENEDFVSMDGIVYSKNGKYLVYCPRKREKPVIVQDGTQVIFNSAFRKCAIYDINFPASLREIQNCAFSSCLSLTSVHLNDELEIIGSFAFHACENLENIYLGKSLKSIRDYAFDRTSALSKIRFPNKLEHIGDSAFVQCPLKDVVIPKSVRKIGKCAFADSLNWCRTKIC